MDVETLRNDLVANQKRFEEKVLKRNTLNVEIVGLEYVIDYIRASINAEEQKEKLIKGEKEKTTLKKP